MRGWIAAVMVVVAALSVAATRPPPRPAATGKYLATVLGCHDCHGPALRGKPMLEDPTLAIFFSSNLTRALPRYSDAALERVLGTGVRPDGTRLWYMDAAPYAILSAADKRALFAYLRSVPAGGTDHPRIKMGPRFIKAMKAGAVRPESLTLARDLANPPPAYGPATARGRYLARTACAGCHTPALTGTPDPQPGDPPDLAIVAAYDRAALRTLLHTGKAPGNREVGDMSKASRDRFANMPSADVDAIHAYLSAWAATRAAKPGSH